MIVADIQSKLSPVSLDDQGRWSCVLSEELARVLNIVFSPIAYPPTPSERFDPQLTAANKVLNGVVTYRNDPYSEREGTVY